jgi:flagellum-specific ATP synthase
VAAILGMLVEISGLDGSLSIGARCDLVGRSDQRVGCEIIGFRNNRALALAYGALEGVGLGSRAILADSDPVVHPTPAWLGRVVNAMGEPIDGKGPLPARSACGFAVHRLPPMPGPGSAARSISASGRSTPSPPAVVDSAWAFSLPPASASPSSFR